MEKLNNQTIDGQQQWQCPTKRITKNVNHSTYTLSNKNAFGVSINKNYNQQYERLRENGRIIKRIINPRRDKLILSSIEKVRSKKMLNVRAKSQHGTRPPKHKSKDKQSKCPNKCSQRSQEYQIRLQNQRMGTRILNTKSIIRSIITSQSKQRNKNNQKINKGVIAFFNPYSIHRASSDQVNKQNLIKYQLKQYYGYGTTMLCITSININTNPIIKNQDLLFLELMVNSDISRRGDRQKVIENKMYQTNIIMYEMLKSTSIKFAVRINKIGEFIPLRIWRIQGVNNIEVGIVDIQFSRFIQRDQLVKNQKNISDSLQTNRKPFYTENITTPQSPQNIQINKQGKIRTLIHQKINRKIRKTNCDQTQSTISIQYMIYSKRYT